MDNMRDVAEFFSFNLDFVVRPQPDLFVHTSGFHQQRDSISQTEPRRFWPRIKQRLGANAKDQSRRRLDGQWSPIIFCPNLVEEIVAAVADPRGKCP